MADDKGPQTIIVKQPEPKRGTFDLRKVIPTAQTRERMAWNFFGLFAILLVIIGIFYGYYYLQTDKGEIVIEKGKNLVDEYGPSALSQKFQQRVRGMTSWDTDTDPESKEVGVIFKALEIVGTSRVPQGNDIILKYDLSVEGTEDDVETTFYCSVKNKEIEGSILPADTVTLSKIRPTTVRCIIPGAQTEDLVGSQTIEATGEFEFKTEEVKLPVYITTDDIYEQVAQSGANDFFELYKIPEKQPIQAVYKGEPAALGIGVSDDGVQPVVIGETSAPFIGISLKNKWSGSIKQIKKLEMTLPEGIEIDESLSPLYLCPFNLMGQRQRKNIYEAPEELLQDVKVEKEGLATFECFLKIDPSIIGEATYANVDYVVSAEYIYELRKRSAAVKIISQITKEQEDLSEEK